MKKKPSPTPATEQYIKWPALLNRSHAWLNSPVYAVRVVSAVMDEINLHGGKDNGSLIVPYSKLKVFLKTSNKNTIALAIAQAEALGLIAVARGHVAKDGTKVPNRFRLTWLSGHNGGPATDEWKDVTSDEQAKAIIAALKQPRRSKRYNSAEQAGELRTKWGKSNKNSSVHTHVTETQKLSPLNGTANGNSSVHTPDTDVQKSSVHTHVTQSVHTHVPASVHTHVTETAISEDSVGTHACDTYLDICPSVERTGPLNAVAGEATAKPSEATDAVREFPAPKKLNGHRKPAAMGSRNSKRNTKPKNCEGAKASGHGADHTAMASNRVIWAETDGAWFQAHPERSHRVRRPFQGETEDPLVGESDYVVIRQTKLGTFIRRPAIGNATLEDSEEVAHAIFDMVAGGAKFTGQDLAGKLIQYRTASLRQ